MITQTETKKMVVISDLHLGNPFCRTKKNVIAFINWAAAQGFDICINGDGLEIAQVSFSKLARDVPEVFQAFKNAANRGSKTFYVVGNHDMALENFLEDWGSFKVAPFLNVISDTGRFRVEHGHLYDPFFVRHPRLYEFSTWLGGLFLNLNPSVYKLWMSLERWKSKRRAKKTGIVGERPEFAQAALELSERGFDAVIFGHTHHTGEVKLKNGKSYLNPGSWLVNCDYVEISGARATLKKWVR